MRTEGTPIPDAPCMEYIPTFGSFIGSMLVNIPYMEHLGMLGNRNLALETKVWILESEDSGQALVGALPQKMG